MSSIRRIYINSYLGYINDTNESLTDFIVDLPDRIENPQDINVVQVSLNFTPKQPSVPLYENKLRMS